MAGVVAVTLPIRMVTRPRADRPAVSVSNMIVDENAAVARLAEAVRIPTVTGTNDARLVDFHDWIADAYPALASELDREVVGDGSLLYTWRGTGGDAPILFAGHFDVLPPGEEAGWTRPPFSGEVEGGYLRGRGSLLTKGPMVAMLEAVDALVREGFVPARTILFAFGHDSESGGTGAAAIAQLLSDRGVHAEWALTGGSGVRTELVPALNDPVALIGTAEKIFVSIRLVAHRELDDAAVPSPVYLENAIGRVSRGLARLEGDPFPARITGAGREMLETLGPHVDPSTRMLIANLWLFERPMAVALGGSAGLREALRSTVTPVVFETSAGGPSGPYEATATVALRIAPWESEMEVLVRIESLLDGLGVEVQIDDDEGSRAIRAEDSTRGSTSGAGEVGPLEASSSDAEGFRLLRRGAFGAFPDLIEAVPGVVPGPSDARHYHRVSEDVYRFLPIRLDAEKLESVSGPNERIRVTEYLGMVRFYAELIREASGAR